VKDSFLEVDYHQISKHGQGACGDSFFSSKTGERTILVLADGLGSGIKASVLSTLTTTMAASFISARMDIKRAAEVILVTLPVCSYRKIGYSTFTIVDALQDGKIRIIEHDNPPYVLLRHGEIIHPDKQAIELNINRKAQLFFSEFQLEPKDRLVFFSDGVPQAGMGRPGMLLGWMQNGVENHIVQLLQNQPSLSAGEISKKLARKAREFDGGRAADDITCAALYLRKPRRTLLVTGPPYKMENDKVMADIVKSFQGAKVICGGTTSEILSRELGIPVLVNLKEMRNSKELPPSADMKGIDLVTEGTITISRALQLLEQDTNLDTLPDNPVKRLMSILTNSDIIDFVVGTKINEAHQDPALPKNLEIRRNLIRRLSQVMEEKYYKQTNITFV
jgi:serine/threonine protein phosphatase PrpC